MNATKGKGRSTSKATATGKGKTTKTGTGTGRGVAARLNAVLHTMREEYQKSDAPWIVAYSGGKDSTLLLHLAWETLQSFPPEQRQRPVYVVANDTLVESPLVINHLRDSLADVRKAVAQAGDLPITVKITEPCIDQTFWVNVIGRGYIPPTRNFRWCTDRMKIRPTNEYLRKIIRTHGSAVLLVGTRRSESQNRRRAMAKVGVVADRLNPHGTLEHCFMFAPLADLSDNDVWMTLMQRKPPWGGSHHRLITLYRNAGGGECPLILTKDDAPSCGTTSPRFGCWTCTVVQKDRSMRGVIDAGQGGDEWRLEMLADFRDWLLELREDDANRQDVRRDGIVKLREDNTRVMGPFKLSVRKNILKRLREIEDEVGESLITPGEMEVIEDIWYRDEVMEEGRHALLFETAERMSA